MKSITIVTTITTALGWSFGLTSISSAASLSGFVNTDNLTGNLINRNSEDDPDCSVPWHDPHQKKMLSSANKTRSNLPQTAPENSRRSCKALDKSIGNLGISDNARLFVSIPGNGGNFSPHGATSSSLAVSSGNVSGFLANTSNHPGMISVFNNFAAKTNTTPAITSSTNSQALTAAPVPFEFSTTGGLGLLGVWLGYRRWQKQKKAGP